MSRRVLVCLALSAVVPASQVQAAIPRGPSPQALRQMQQIQQYQAIQEEMARRQREGGGGGGRSSDGDEEGKPSKSPRKGDVPSSLKGVAGKGKGRSQTGATNTAARKTTRTGTQTGKRSTTSGSRTAGTRKKPSTGTGGSTGSSTAMTRTPTTRKRPVARPTSASSAPEMSEP